MKERKNEGQRETTKAINIERQKDKTKEINK